MQRRDSRVWPLALLLLLAACPEGGFWRGGREAAEESPLGAVLAAPPRGADVHLVRLIARGGRYAFEPAEVRIQPGDVVRFVHTEHLPDAVVFEVEQAPPGGAELLREQGADAGPLLTAPGAVFEVHFPNAPEGRYPFHSVPHAEFGMRGVVIIGEEETPHPSP